MTAKKPHVPQAKASKTSLSSVIRTPSGKAGSTTSGKAVVRRDYRAG